MINFLSFDNLNILHTGSVVNSFNAISMRKISNFLSNLEETMHFQLNFFVHYSLHDKLYNL